MRFRTLALALALTFGATGLVHAKKVIVNKASKVKPRKAKQAKAGKFKQAKIPKVKAHKAKKFKPVHKG